MAHRDKKVRALVKTTCLLANNFEKKTLRQVWEDLVTTKRLLAERSF